MSVGLEKMNAIVTGWYPDNIGQGVVEGLLQEGCNVVFTYENHFMEDAANQFASELSQKYLGRTVRAIRMDIQSKTDQRFMIKEAGKCFEWALPNILINTPRMVDHLAYLDGIFCLNNVVANLWMTAEKAHHGNAEIKGKKKYSIINLLSESHNVFAGKAINEASKAALKAFTDVQALELPPFLTVNWFDLDKSNRRLNNAQPWKDKDKDDSIPIGRKGPLEIAENVIKLVKSQFDDGSSIMARGGSKHNFGPSIFASPSRMASKL